MENLEHLSSTCWQSYYSQLNILTDGSGLVATFCSPLLRVEDILNGWTCHWMTSLWLSLEHSLSVRTACSPLFHLGSNTTATKVENDP